MVLHINNWVTRSTQLAGRIKNLNLPTVSIIKHIKIKASVIISKQEDNAPMEYKNKKIITHINS
jgi:hypothetical protein